MPKFLPKKNKIISYRADDFTWEYRTNFITKIRNTLGYKVSKSNIERFKWYILQMSPRREKRVLQLAKLLLKKIG